MSNIKVIDADSLPKYIKSSGAGTDNDPFILERFALDMNLQISRGKVSGISHVNVFGKSPAGIQTTITDFWERANATPTQQIWTAPTQARIHDIASTSTSDDGDPVGVGARTIRIWYLADWDTAESAVDLTMNGTTNVVTPACVIINRMEILTKGATNVNVGTITATAQTDGTVTAQINPGNGRTQMAIYGIPSIQKAYITNHDASMLSAGTTPATVNGLDVSLLINPEPDTELTNFINYPAHALANTSTTYLQHYYKPHFEVTGPALIKMQGIANLADTDASASFDMIIVNN